MKSFTIIYICLLQRCGHLKKLKGHRCS